MYRRAWHHGRADRPRVVVTGASGFVGARVAHVLAAGGLRVVGVGRRRTPASAGFEYRSMSLVDGVGYRDLLRDVDCVVHCAGLAHGFGRRLGEADYRRANVDLTEELIAAAINAEASHFVLISSSSVYGAATHCVTEETPTRPDTPYSRSKVAAEQAACKRCVGGGMNLTVLRPATVYGPRDPGNVARLIRSIVSRRFVWIGDGKNRKSLLHVDDLADSVARVVNNRPAHGVFNIAAPPVSMRRVVEIVETVGGVRSPSVTLPGGAIRLALWAAATASLQLGPAPRVHRTVQKWLSEDTICSARFEARYGAVPWTDPAVGLAEETRWLLGAGDQAA